MSLPFFPRGGRKRVRPGFVSLVFSTLVGVGAVALALMLPFDAFFVPVLPMIAVAVVVSAYQLRGIRQGLPAPHGQGKIAISDLASTARAGWMISIGGGLVVLLLLGSVFFLPPEVYFAVVFSVAGGLPLSQTLLFGEVTLLERSHGGRIFRVTEDDTDGEEPILRKTYDLVVAE